MDVRVTRETTGDVNTSIYRKPTFTGLYTTWDSFSPTCYKINLVKCLVHRVRRICSPRNVDLELEKLRNILRKNGYPENVLEKHVTKQPPSRDPFIGPSRCPVFIRLPWLGSTPAGLLEGKIKKAVRVAYFAARVQFVYSTARAFRLPKDRLPTPFMSNVIYEFECRCCGCRYVGRTSQHLIARVKQHVPRYLLPTQQTRKRSRHASQESTEHQSAIAQHLMEKEECRQRYEDQQFTVLAKARSEMHLRILEAAFIHHTDPSLCRQKKFVTDLELFGAKFVK